MATRNRDYVRARETFVAATKEGPNVVVQAGRVVRANDPLVRGREALFQSLDEYAQEQEQAGRRQARAAATTVADETDGDTGGD